MVQTPFFSSFSGYISMELRGGQAEHFLNEAVKRGFRIWDVRVKSSELIELKLLVRDFFKLRPLLKETGCRIHVNGRYGLPFYMDRLGRRKVFAAGLIGFILGLFLLTSLVWQVQVEGNEKIKTADILSAAKQQGLRPFQWTFRLKDPDELSRELIRSLPGTAWIGVERMGTKVLIKVVESTRPDPKELLSPRNLIAGKNAVVTQIFAEKGIPRVAPNTYVRKGDVLISGIIGSEQYRQVVPAEGKVMGLVWYTSTIEVPKTQVHFAYTGTFHNRFYLVFGTRALQITGYGKPQYAEAKAIGERKTLHFGKWVLPFGWLQEKVYEVVKVEHSLDDETARAMGLERAREEILRGGGKDTRITTETLLSSQTENGMLKLRVHFEVEEEITQEQPIVEGS